MKKRIFIVFLAAILMLTLMAPASAAEPTQAIKDVFNAAQLTPRQSTNPTIAKYVKDVASEIGLDNKSSSTYNKTVAAYNWVAKNLVISASQYTASNDIPYIEGAALFGFKNKKGPCEVDSAIFYYLFGYIGLDTRWARGEKSGGTYHMWAEVLIGDNTFAFDTFPGQEMAFAHRTSTTMGSTVVNGFTIVGYYTGGTPTATTAAEYSNVGGMPYMDPPLRRAQTISTSVTYSDGSTFTWSIPAIGEKQVTIADITKFYEPSFAEWHKDIVKARYGGEKGIAGKTLPVYTVKAGSKIYSEGASMLNVAKLRLVDGKLQMNGVSFDMNKELRQNDIPTKKVNVAEGKYYGVCVKGSYTIFVSEGYYVVEIPPWNDFHFVTDPKSPYFYSLVDANMFKVGYFIIHVQK